MEVVLEGTADVPDGGFFRGLDVAIVSALDGDQFWRGDVVRLAMGGGVTGVTGVTSVGAGRHDGMVRVRCEKMPLPSSAARFCASKRRGYRVFEKKGE